MMASAPESKRASVATLAANDSGAEAIILRESTVKSHDFDTSLGLTVASLELESDRIDLY